MKRPIEKYYIQSKSIGQKRSSSTCPIPQDLFHSRVIGHLFPAAFCLSINSETNCTESQLKKGSKELELWSRLSCPDGRNDTGQGKCLLVRPCLRCHLMQIKRTPEYFPPGIWSPSRPQLSYIHDHSLLTRASDCSEFWLLVPCFLSSPRMSFVMLFLSPHRSSSSPPLHNRILKSKNPTPLPDRSRQNEPGPLKQL